MQAHIKHRQHVQALTPGYGRSRSGRSRRGRTVSLREARMATTALRQQLGNALHGLLHWKAPQLPLGLRPLQTAKERVLGALHLNSSEDLQDFLASMILSECAYKKLEMSPQPLARKISEYCRQFPEGWVQVQALQVTLQEVPHHYIVALGPDAMYVAFMGTKQARDLVTDVYVTHEPMWAESLALATDDQVMPSAHRGFLRRARAIDILHLYEQARSQDRRLVLCGHSLGGAVAKLCTLRLLRELPDPPTPQQLRCVAFATPAVGNTALARLVDTAGWSPYFSTYFLPEDQLLRLLNFFSTRSNAVALRKAAQTQGVLPGAAVASAGQLGVVAGSSAVGPEDRAKRASEALGQAMTASLEAADAAEATEPTARPNPTRSRLWARFKRAASEEIEAEATAVGPAKSPSPTGTAGAGPVDSANTGGMGSMGSIRSFDSAEALLEPVDVPEPTTSTSVADTEKSPASTSVAVTGVKRRRAWPGAGLWRGGNDQGGQGAWSPFWRAEPRPGTGGSITSTLSDASAQSVSLQSADLGPADSTASAARASGDESAGARKPLHGIAAMGQRIRSSPQVQRLLELAPQLPRMRVPAIFHHFGTHMYLGHQGAHPVASTPPPMPRTTPPATGPATADTSSGTGWSPQPPRPRTIEPRSPMVLRAPWGATATVALPSHPFAYHRMAAYRARVLHVVDNVLHNHAISHQSSGQLLPGLIPTTADSAATAPGQQPTTVAAAATGARPVAPAVVLPSGQVLAPVDEQIKLRTDIVPPIRPLRAVAHPPLSLVPSTFPPTSIVPSGPQQLLVQVQGLRLQRCRSIQAFWCEPNGRQTPLTCRLVKAGTGSGRPTQSVGTAGDHAEEEGLGEVGGMAGSSAVGGGWQQWQQQVQRALGQVGRVLNWPWDQHRDAPAPARPRPTRLSYAMVSVSVPPSIMQQLITQATHSATHPTIPALPNTLDTEPPTSTSAKTSAALPAATPAASVQSAAPVVGAAGAVASASDVGTAAAAVVAGATAPATPTPASTERMTAVSTARLQLCFASDFHIDSIDVQMRPWQLGVVAASSATAAALEHLLDSLTPPVASKAPARRLAMLQTVMGARNWRPMRTRTPTHASNPNVQPSPDHEAAPPASGLVEPVHTASGPGSAVETAVPAAASAGSAPSRFGVPAMAASVLASMQNRVAGNKDAPAANSPTIGSAATVPAAPAAAAALPPVTSVAWEASSQVLAAGVAAAAAAAATAAPSGVPLPPPAPIPPLPKLSAALSLTAAASRVMSGRAPALGLLSGAEKQGQGAEEDGSPALPAADAKAHRFTSLPAPPLQGSGPTAPPMSVAEQPAATSAALVSTPAAGSRQADSHNHQHHHAASAVRQGAASWPWSRGTTHPHHHHHHHPQHPAHSSHLHPHRPHSAAVRQARVHRAVRGFLLDVVDPSSEDHAAAAQQGTQLHWMNRNVKQALSKLAPIGGLFKLGMRPTADPQSPKQDMPQLGDSADSTSHARTRSKWDALLVVMSVDDSLTALNHGACAASIATAHAAGVPILPLLLLPSTLGATSLLPIRQHVTTLATACGVDVSEVVLVGTGGDEGGDGPAVTSLSGRLQALAGLPMAVVRAASGAGGGGGSQPGSASNSRSAIPAGSSGNAVGPSSVVQGGPVEQQGGAAQDQAFEEVDPTAQWLQQAKVVAPPGVLSAISGLLARHYVDKWLGPDSSTADSQASSGSANPIVSKL